MDLSRGSTTGPTRICAGRHSKCRSTGLGAPFIYMDGGFRSGGFGLGDWPGGFRLGDFGLGDFGLGDLSGGFRAGRSVMALGTDLETRWNVGRRCRIVGRNLAGKCPLRWFTTVARLHIVNFRVWDRPPKARCYTHRRNWKGHTNRDLAAPLRSFSTKSNRAADLWIFRDSLCRRVVRSPHRICRIRYR